MNKRKTSAKPLKTSLLEKALEGQAEVNVALGRLMEKVDRINGLKRLSHDLAEMPSPSCDDKEPVQVRAQAVDVLDVIVGLTERLATAEATAREYKRRYQDKDRIAREVDRKWMEERQERRKADLKVADLENIVLTRGEVAIEILNALKSVKAIDITQRFKKRLLKILEGQSYEKRKTNSGGCNGPYIHDLIRDQSCKG